MRRRFFRIVAAWAALSALAALSAAGPARAPDPPPRLFPRRANPLALFRNPSFDTPVGAFPRADALA